MKTRVGILTMYYKSVNYGGVLQAYALTKFLNDLGVEASQVTYDFWRKKSITLRNSLLNPFRKMYLMKFLKNRYKSFRIFRESIPHTNTLYSDATITEANEYYDIFISGSDQVWNFDSYREPFFLTFSKKKKVAYGAGMGQSISKINSEILHSLLNGYSAISVRENESVGLLGDCTHLGIEVVVDPTLLLSRKDWDTLITSDYSGDYVFCYFLGNDMNMRNIAKSFAKKKNMPIYTIPHVARFMKEDLFFGNKRIYEASPNDFISLIKNAKYVFTDSFHCCVFSSIYHKEYFVFERKGKKGMSSRIKDITALFDMESRFCYEGRNNISYIENLIPTQYNEEKYEILKKKSISFLKANCL